MAAYRLGNLYSRFYVETDTLLLSFCTSRTYTAQLQRESCIIRLHAAWYRFCRELIVESAACTPTTTNGTLIPKAPSIKTRYDVIPRLRLLNTTKQHKPRLWWEPRWSDPTKCIQAAQSLKIANFGSVSSALGMTPSPVEHLRLVRNFIAHRNEDTAIKMKPVLQVYGINTTANTTADQLLIYTPPMGGTIFEKWVREIQLMAQAAVQ